MDLKDIEYAKYENLHTWSQQFLSSDTNIIHLNIRSIRKHFNELLALLSYCIAKRTLNVIVLTEVNIKSEEVPFYRIPGYVVFPNTRETKRGGGILVFVRDDLQFTTRTPQIPLKATEITHGVLKTKIKNVHILSIYRPPNTNKLIFIKELDEILTLIPSTEEIILIGDINIDISQDISTSLCAYKNVLCKNGLRSAIPTSESTREALVDGRRVTSSNIDHVCVRANGRPLDARAHLLTCTLSDHYMVGISLSTTGKVLNSNTICKI